MNEKYEEIAYFQPGVMVHKKSGGEEFDIHDIYFGKKGNVITYTIDALSPRTASVEELKNTLLKLLEQNNDEIVTGDLNYSYSKEDIQFWISYIEASPIEYTEPED